MVNFYTLMAYNYTVQYRNKPRKSAGPPYMADRINCSRHRSRIDSAAGFFHRDSSTEILPPRFFVTTYGNRIPLSNYTIFYSLTIACVYTFKLIVVHPNLLTLLSYHRPNSRYTIRNYSGSRYVPANTIYEQ